MPSESELLKSSYKRAKAVWYICRWIGTPYKIGGDDFSGFDCSGLVLETLQGVGLEKRHFDLTADGLWQKYKTKEVEKPSAGCLVFWFDSYYRAVHIEMLIDDYHVVGASGGGFKVKTVEDAIVYNAYVKMNDLNYRGSNYKIVDPFKL